MFGWEPNDFQVANNYILEIEPFWGELTCWKEDEFSVLYECDAEVRGDALVRVRLGKSPIQPAVQPPSVLLCTWTAELDSIWNVHARLCVPGRIQLTYLIW